MDKLRELAIAFVWLIRIGTSARVVYCFMKMIGNDDEVSVYRKRIKHAIGFLVLSECIWQLKDMAVYYFG